MINIQAAARALVALYQGQPWFIGVSIRGRKLIVHMNTDDCPDDQWIDMFVGFDVQFHKEAK